MRGRWACFVTESMPSDDRAHRSRLPGADGWAPAWLASRSVLVGPVEPSGPELRRHQRVRGVTGLHPRRAGEKSY